MKTPPGRCPYKEMAMWRNRDTGSWPSDDGELEWWSYMPRTPRIARKLLQARTGKEGFPYRSQREDGAGTLTWTSSLQICERTNFCCFKPQNKTHRNPQTKHKNLHKKKTQQHKTNQPTKIQKSHPDKSTEEELERILITKEGKRRPHRDW